ASSGIIKIAGTFTPGSNAYTTTGSTIEFNASTAQTIPAFTYDGLTLNNSAGASLGGNVTVGGALALSSGTLAVGSTTLTLNPGSSSTAGTLSSGPAGTVSYNQGTTGQSVLAANYGNLTFSNFTKVLPSTGTVG